MNRLEFSFLASKHTPSSVESNKFKMGCYTNGSSKMAFKCPPEVVLRNSIRQTFLKPTLEWSAVSSRTYRAAVITELGKPLQIQNLKSQGSVPNGHVRVGVHNCGINFSDILQSQGKYQEKPKLPHVAGAEIAGEVLEVGEDVDDLKAGDRVFGLSIAAGGFSEETIVPAMMLSQLSGNIPYAKAASFVVSYCTAYIALTRKANIQEGETVLVTAAAGGTGLAAVDIAANVFNCNVIAACGSDEKCELTKAKGAAHTINYNKENIRERVKAFTGGDGANIILDMVGGDVWEHCVKSAAFEGRLLVIGFASGDIPKLSTNLLLIKSCSAIGLYWGNYGARGHPAFLESIQDVGRLLAEGKISPHVGKTFTLSQINDAFQYILERKSTGKIVIDTRS